MNIGLIITAGGSSVRFGNTNKLLEKINGKEVIRYTVDAFLGFDLSQIVISANRSIIEDLKIIFKNYSDVKIIEGGSTRQESVYKALKSINCDYVLIHDGARPLVTPDVISGVIDNVQLKKAVSVMVKTTDTIKEVDETGKIIKTIDRSKLYNTQTPQAFEYELINQVHEKLKDKNYTDDSGMVEDLGYDVFMSKGDYRNIKITTKSDIELAKVYLSSL